MATPFLMLKIGGHVSGILSSWQPSIFVLFHSFANHLLNGVFIFICIILVVRQLRECWASSLVSSVLYSQAEYIISSARLFQLMKLQLWPPFNLMGSSAYCPDPRQDPDKNINTCYTAARGESLSPGSNNRLTSFSMKAPFPVWEVILWLRMPEPSGQDRCSVAGFHLPAKRRAKGPQYNIVLQNTGEISTQAHFSLITIQVSPGNDGHKTTTVLLRYIFFSG